MVEVVDLVHRVVGALLNCAKYRRKREEGLFSNIERRKKRAKFKNIGEKRVKSFVMYRPVRPISGHLLLCMCVLA